MYVLIIFFSQDDSLLYRIDIETLCIRYTNTNHILDAWLGKGQFSKQELYTSLFSLFASGKVFHFIFIYLPFSC